MPHFEEALNDLSGVARRVNMVGTSYYHIVLLCYFEYIIFNTSSFQTPNWNPPAGIAQYQLTKKKPEGTGGEPEMIVIYKRQNRLFTFHDP